MIYSKCLFTHICISRFHNIIQEDDYEPYQRMNLLLLGISKRNILLLRLAPILENAWV